MERNADYEKRKLALSAQYRAYIYQNPAMKQLLHDFTSSVLAVQPDDVPAYAKQYFNNMLPAASQATTTTTNDGNDTPAGDK